MENLVKDFLSRKNFAVVGSFRNESKYAYRILDKLKKEGYEVYPINPSLQEVLGEKCYKRISDIPFTVDVASIVTPPEVTEKIVQECLEKGIKRLWLQPGAENDNVINFCCNNDIKIIHSLCIMLEKIKKRKDNDQKN